MTVRFVFILLLSSLLFFNSCSTPLDSGFLRIAISSNPKSLDPPFATDVVSGVVAAKIYNGLVRFEGTSIVPDLADTWTISADGTRYLFRLRGDVKFHNGEAFTARDVVRNFARFLDTSVENPRRWVLAAVDTCSARGDTALLVVLKEPSATFLSMLAMPAAYVRHLQEGEKKPSVDAYIGTGPYAFRRWESDAEIELERYDGYFDVRPQVKGIVYKILPEALTALSLLKRGEIDLCEVPDAQIAVLVEDPVWRDHIMQTRDLAVRYVAINTERITDPRVREAFNLAIDRDAITARVLRGLADPAWSPVPPDFSACPSPLFAREVRGIHVYRPDEAKAILLASGFDSPLTLLRAAQRGTLEPAEAVAGYLRDCGLKVSVQLMEPSSLSARVNRGDYDLALFSWYADYPDAENFLQPLFHSKNVGGAGNRARLKDADVDAVLDRVVAIADGEERRRLIAEAEAAVTKRAPWILLWYPQTAVAVAPRFEGFTPPALFNGDKGTSYRLGHTGA